MKQIYEDTSFTIGNTPIVKLNNITDLKNIFVKMEARNPSFSVKCRIGSNMIWDAEKKGLIDKSKTLIEATSGNTGISLAFVASARGYKLLLTMPETMSLERRKLLKALGAELVLTDGKLGMSGALQKADELVKASPNKFHRLNQFSNPANPEIHFKTTGPEIWESTQGEIDIFVAGVGTGGTISGVANYIKNEKGKKIHVVAVEPEESPVIFQKLNGLEMKPSPHKIQGIGPGFIPENLDLSLVDEVVHVSSNEAIETARNLMKKEGILAGISSGAAVAAAIKVGKKFPNKKIVTILPSATERYLSSALFADFFSEKELTQ
ncbi:cysteine synthase A [Paraphotobacterium marinum]|uniref:cysteine synthase A n=1 Tax=Paraphotobacterium marinum TaxID=1755811 RepID=UPI0039E9C669